MERCCTGRMASDSSSHGTPRPGLAGVKVASVSRSASATLLSFLTCAQVAGRARVSHNLHSLSLHCYPTIIAAGENFIWPIL